MAVTAVARSKPREEESYPVSTLVTAVTMKLLLEAVLLHTKAADRALLIKSTSTGATVKGSVGAGGHLASENEYFAAMGRQG